MLELADYYPLIGVVEPVDGAALGTWGGAAAGILVYELAHYWYHRAAQLLGLTPEAGAIHGLGIHRNNYSDLPLWDMVFRTFHNPAAAQARAGFYPGASSRLAAMLAFRDVSRPALL